MQVYCHADLWPMAEKFSQWINGIGDVGWSTCRVLSKNFARSNQKCFIGGRWSSRRAQICDGVDRKWSISELRKKSLPLVSPGLIEIVFVYGLHRSLIEIIMSASLDVVRMGKMASICPDGRGHFSPIGINGIGYVGWSTCRVLLCPVVTESLSRAVLEITGLKDIGVMTLTFQGHVTSSMPSSFDPL